MMRHLKFLDLLLSKVIILKLIESVFFVKIITKESNDYVKKYTLSLLFLTAHSWLQPTQQNKDWNAYFESFENLSLDERWRFWHNNIEKLPIHLQPEVVFYNQTDELDDFSDELFDSWKEKSNVLFRLEPKALTSESFLSYARRISIKKQFLITLPPVLYHGIISSYFKDKGNYWNDTFVS